MPVSGSMSLLIFPDAGTIFLFTVVRQLFGFGLTYGLWKFYQRWPAASFRLSRHAWQAALACVVAAAIDVFLTDGWIRAFHLPALPLLIERGTLFARLAL